MRSEDNRERTGNPAASKKQKSSKAAGASVQVSSEEDTIPITSPTEKVVPTTGRQEQPGTELRSDQWQVSTGPCVVLHTYSLLLKIMHVLVMHACLVL